MYIKKKNIIRPHNKYKELKLYIQSGDKIFRKDIVKMGFNRVDMTLYNYCVRNKLYLRKVDEEHWVKDYSSVRMHLKPDYKKPKSRYVKKHNYIDNYCL